MKKILIRTLIALLVLVVVALVVVFFSLNSIVKKAVETFGPQMTKVEVRLGGADISPFSGSGSLKQLFVGNPDGYKTPFAFQLGSVKVGVEIGSVLADTVVVDEINIQDPEVNLEGTLDGNNLSKILDNLNASSATQEQQKNAPPPPGEKKQKKFIVKDLTLNGAKVHVIVSAFGKSVDQTLTIPDLHLQNIGTGEGGVSAAELSRQVLQPVLAGAVKAASDALANNALKNLGNNAGSTINNAAKGALTNLFK